MRNRTRLTLSALVAVTVAVAVAALSWACVPTARISLNPQSGPAGTDVTVVGAGFNEGTVTILWNGTEQLKNVDASGGNEQQGHGFTTQVTVPATAPPGCHTITATAPGQRLPAGATFEIPGSGCSNPPASRPTQPRVTTPTSGGGNTNGFFPTSSNVNCQGRGVTAVGTSGKDTIEGTSGVDVIASLGGNDTVRGLGGNDVICGGAGRDKLVGGTGADRLSGGAGRDRLLGGPGGDRMNGGAGKDTCVGGPGRDRTKSC